MTTLEEALLEENESLTKIIKSERSEHESQKKALIEKYEKQIMSLQKQEIELAQYVKNLSDDCNDALSNALQKQKDMYEKLVESSGQKLEKLVEELANLKTEYESLKTRYEELKKDIENL